MIYDCFTFFNELELLEVRFAELYPIVDSFVIVEGTQTFTGIEKKLFFSENKERFAKYLDKVIHIKVSDFSSMPDITKMKFYNQDIGYRMMVDKNISAWTVEAFQRNQILQGLKKCNVTDIILISDVDEIPSQYAIERIQNEKLHGNIIGFEQDMYVYYLNAKCHKKWVGTKAVLYDHLYSPQEVRLTSPAKIMKNAGWHFSFLGGVDRIVDKLNAFSHQELNINERRDKNTIKFFLDMDINVLESGQAYDTRDSLEGLPEFIIENKSKFSKFIKSGKKPESFSADQMSILRNEVIRLQEQNNELKMENEKLKYLATQK